ncbi:MULTISPECIES: HNH endonuclease signature motif containing protein [unclassified Chelatococcus]|uniref:HNH endonuclease n=1 Tax=unclassified Chelatococcus TaxID=2638111 RepID=UPI001BCF66C0|nr:MULTISPECIES: HNH endonuclease signature motif containing protein [unclassified Chelatococcus]MBS7737928.1 HNH endonuclease [Chelatococcus sp. HY11]MCO5077103.1 HNH endonuclease [Chelatococcus sp.]
MADDRRPWRGLYKTAAWRQLRLSCLAAHPLCVMCEEVGDVTPADTVDHKIPHRGDTALFFDPGNLQSLCKRCHDSHKKRIENGQIVTATGLDGWPI